MKRNLALPGPASSMDQQTSAAIAQGSINEEAKQARIWLTNAYRHSRGTLSTLLYRASSDGMSLQKDVNTLFGHTASPSKIPRLPTRMNQKTNRFEAIHDY
ncbi:hypothetical protein PGT21_006717 [Puccinia graminis f. sp. tritici]|uniref:Uncharacterized protein n=1 Tax=Puccinia graminis f. sp. tritici TaxID=56615 RepID=A0A5B0Q1W9_PUCGR|nr:hypothetical protein PGT21_006717 [Puccinia graminis f. sp. tritici]